MLRQVINEPPPPLDRRALAQPFATPRADSTTGMSTSSSPSLKARSHTVPLDYSFMGLSALSDMTLHDPVSGKKKAPHGGDDAGGGAAAAASRKAGGTSDTASSTLDASGGASLSTARGKASASSAGASVSLRVNNNKISNLDDMHDALGTVFDDPSKLQWLDLSGNALASIASTAFAPYPDIYTLHLHGNKLQRYADIDSLAACLPRLHALTLHGNPVEEKKHYRNYVIASFPKLQQLDFSSVTRGDREKAETWATIYKRALTSPKRNGRGGASGNDIDQDI